MIGLFASNVSGMSKFNAPFSQKQQVAVSMMRPRRVTAAPPRDFRRRHRRLRRRIALAQRRLRGRLGGSDDGGDDGGGKGKEQSAPSAARRGGSTGVESVGRGLVRAVGGGAGGTCGKDDDGGSTRASVVVRGV